MSRGRPWFSLIVTTGLWVIVIAVTAALALGGYRALTDGRFRGTHRVRGADPTAGEPMGSEAAAEQAEDTVFDRVRASVTEAALGERATLVQFSSAFCAPCRVTRRTLAEVTELVPGVVHLEIDAENHLQLVRDLDVRRTPTTLVLDGRGREVTRAAGAPTRDQVLSTLAGLEV